MASSLELGNAVQEVLDHVKKEEEGFSRAMQLVLSSVMTLCLQTAVELRVFDIIAKTGEGAKLSPEEIAAQMTTNNPAASAMLDRILRLLASYSALSCAVVSDNDGSNIRRLYSLCPASKYFVTNEDSASLGPILTLGHDKVSLDTWSQLKFSVLEGGLAFSRAHGMHAFQYAGSDLRFNKIFNAAMHNHTTIVMKKILEHYKGFQDLGQLVDVGGGLGVSLNQITSKYPHIKGICFDLPHVVENSPSYPGVEKVGGDMFESVPCGDAVFMKWILHDWTDEQCIKLLKNCHKAIPNNGKIIVVEAILPDMLENSVVEKNTFAHDVFMMTQINLGGKERSKREFLALATGAGFGGIKFVCCVCSYWVIEFYK